MILYTLLSVFLLCNFPFSKYLSGHPKHIEQATMANYFLKAEAFEKDRIRHFICKTPGEFPTKSTSSSNSSLNSNDSAEYHLNHEMIVVKSHQKTGWKR